MIILTGASASGKTVTALELQKRFGLVKAITTTTREKRVGETDGVEYFFITKEEFKKRLTENKFVEHSLYNDNFYGCGIDQIADNKIVVLDPNGLHAFNELKNRNDVIFNQDLSERAILIELGGVDNTIDEITSSLEVIAYAINEYILTEMK